MSFGAWAIGGESFGAVEPADALDALARAEELGVNFVDTAAVYGNSEAILGRFLKGRRDGWYVASKYSGQPQGMTALVEEQLRTLGTDRIDFYQIHWAPNGSDRSLYEELDDLKRAGKVRFAGVSLYSAGNIDFLLSETDMDGFQVPFGLLDPRPLICRLSEVRESGVAVIARSCLRDGFLTGKYTANSVFADPADRRSDWSRTRIAETAAAAGRFQFLAEDAGSLLEAAISYPLQYSEVSTVVLSTKNPGQASANFGFTPTAFGPEAMARIEATQDELGLLTDPLHVRLRSLLGSVLRRVRRVF